MSAIEGSGRKGYAIEADSGEPTAITSAVAAAQAKLGSLDAVVVNAGTLATGSIEDFPIEQLDRMLAVNVRGVFLAI